MRIIKNQALKNFNTFGISAFSKYFVSVESRSDLIGLINSGEFSEESKLVLGGGSNVLFACDFDGLLLKNGIKGIKVVKEDNRHVLIEAGGGEDWDSFVEYCVDRNYGGAENLSLIPGTVGAAPIQNIGAYGAELSDIFESLEAIDLETGETLKFYSEDCKFDYRMSIFKDEFKNRLFITEVVFRLMRVPEINLTYSELSRIAEEKYNGVPSVKQVRDTVIEIRKSKLPDPAVLPNAGSFFKNPEISRDFYNSLKKDHPDLKGYLTPGKSMKISAAWLIESCGLKGFKIKDAGTYERHALVVVNHGNASGKEIEEFGSYIINKVNEKFGIRLLPEVNIIN